MAKRTRQLASLSQLLRTLGDQTRLRILLELQDGPRNVTAMVKKLRKPQPTVSHHLGLLRRAELVTTERNGKEIIYSLNTSQGRNERALQAMLNGSCSIRVGSLVLGLSKKK